MSATPYRSAASEPRPAAAPELFYQPVTTGLFAPGFLPFLFCLLVGGLGAALTEHATSCVGVGVGVGAVAAVVRRRRSDAAGILFRVDDGVLALTRGRRGQRLAHGSLEDVLDVKIDTATYYTAPANFTATPGYGVHNTNTGGTVDQSRIALLLRTREEPLYLTSDRTSHSEATEWLATIRRFLRAHGWIPIEERGDATKPADAPMEPSVLFVVEKGAIRHSLQAVVRRFELVVEARERVIDGPEAGASTCVIGPEELPLFTDLLLEGSGERPRYEGLEQDELVIELVRDLFAEPHGLEAMTELRAWLDEREMPYRFDGSAVSSVR